MEDIKVQGALEINFGQNYLGYIVDFNQLGIKDNFRRLDEVTQRIQERGPLPAHVQDLHKYLLDAYVRLSHYNPGTTSIQATRFHGRDDVAVWLLFGAPEHFKNERQAYAFAIRIEEDIEEETGREVLEDVNIFDYVARDDEEIIWPKEAIEEVRRG